MLHFILTFWHAFIAYYIWGPLSSLLVKLDLLSENTRTSDNTRWIYCCRPRTTGLDRGKYSANIEEWSLPHTGNFLTSVSFKLFQHVTSFHSSIMGWPGWFLVQAADPTLLLSQIALPNKYWLVIGRGHFPWLVILEESRSSQYGVLSGVLREEWYTHF